MERQVEPRRYNLLEVLGVVLLLLLELDKILVDMTRYLVSRRRCRRKIALDVKEQQMMSDSLGYQRSTFSVSVHTCLEMVALHCLV